MSNTQKTVDATNLPPPPDIRQSVCHTLMASGFMLLNLLNPIAVADMEDTFHRSIMVALAFVVFISWFFFAKRLKTWRELPIEIRSRATRRPQDLKQRAVNHLMMSLLAVTLTAFALYARLAVPSEKFGSIVDKLLLCAVAVVGVLAVAVLARTVRDLNSARKLLK